MPITFSVKEIPGLPGTSNWVLFRPSYDNNGSEFPPSFQHCPKHCVVFFPGDISDFFGVFIEISSDNPTSGTSVPKDSTSGNTSSDESNERASSSEVNFSESLSRSHYLDAYRTYPYSLEGLAWVLSQKYPRHDLVIIRPSLITADGFSIYNHFIQTPMDEIGQPIKNSSSVLKATSQLIHILFNLYNYQETNNIGSEDDAKSRTLHTITGRGSSEIMSMVPPIILNGFSKGGLVISQLIKEAECADIGEAGCVSSKYDNISHIPADTSILNAPEKKQIFRYPVRLLWRNIVSVVYMDAAINYPDTLFRFTPQQLSWLYQCTCATPNSSSVNMSSECRSCLKFFFHYTPRQLRSPSRFFLRGELYDVKRDLELAGFRFIFFHEYYASAPNHVCTNNMHFSLLYDFDTQFDWKYDSSIAPGNKIPNMHSLPGASVYRMPACDALQETDSCIPQKAKESNNDFVFFFDHWQQQTGRLPIC